MRIDSSAIGMESARRYTSSKTRTTRFLVKDYMGNAAHNEGTKKENEKLESNMASVESLMELRQRVAQIQGRPNIRTVGQSALDSFRQQTIRSILAMFLGVEKANVLTVSAEHYFEETETTSFSATGLVKTADGREISINLHVEMTRTFSEYYKEELQIMQVNTCDPLVLNFDGNAAELSDQKFLFDIDGDGSRENISKLGSGSGYLALDRNRDGKINDGNELFGPKSGNGFADLACYDEDGNGWIDEGDAIFSKLKIWCMGSDDKEVLYTLKEKGVGAICLQNAQTQFSLNGANNQTNGYIRNSGVFLYEDGNVGTMQHLDVAQ